MKKSEIGLKIKSAAPWRMMVQSLSPAFDYVLQNFVHAEDRRIYRESKYCKPVSPALGEGSIEIFRDVPEFKEFAAWLRSRLTPEMLESAKSEMLASASPLDFTTTLNSRFDRETNLGILRFCLSDKVLALVMPYFGFVPQLARTIVMYNIVKPGNDAPSGSQLWHRDGDIYKLLDLFICVTDVDDEAGPYSGVDGRYIPYHAAIPTDSSVPGGSVYYNSRVTDEGMRRYVPDSAVLKLAGPAGTTAAVNSAYVYHKGGFCKTRDRIMIRVMFMGETSHAVPSILKTCGLENDPEALALLDSDVKRRLVRSHDNEWYHRHKKDHPAFLLGRRLLTYYMPPRSL